MTFRILLALLLALTLSQASQAQGPVRRAIAQVRENIAQRREARQQGSQITFTNPRPVLQMSPIVQAGFVMGALLSSCPGGVCGR